MSPFILSNRMDYMPNISDLWNPRAATMVRPSWYPARIIIARRVERLSLHIATTHTFSPKAAKSGSARRSQIMSEMLSKRSVIHELKPFCYMSQAESFNLMIGIEIFATVTKDAQHRAPSPYPEPTCSVRGKSYIDSSQDPALVVAEYFNCKD